MRVKRKKGKILEIIARKIREKKMTADRFVSYLPYNCPEKLKKSINDCSNPSDVLDTLLKVTILTNTVKSNGE